MSYIYHIIERGHWSKAKEDGVYTPESIKIEGFIHCSKLEQVCTVANNFYKNKNDLLLLKIDESKISAKCVYEAPLEAPDSGLVFPHIYGDLNLDAVIDVLELNKDEENQFVLPIIN